jgi:formiminoglutamase
MPPRPSPPRADDLRLGDYVEFWSGGPSPLRPGRPVLVGFPQDVGVRRNRGRPGAAGAPLAIRRWLFQLAPWDPITGADLTRAELLDVGNVHVGSDLETSQAALAAVVAAVRAAGSVPVVLGGGHETAFGCYMGHAAAGPVAVVNIDAHLDVRPTLDGRGHSGSPFRQALEHPTHPLGPGRYVCFGAQPHAVSREHLNYARGRGCVVRWLPEVRGRLTAAFAAERERLAAESCPIHVTLDADAVDASEVPGVSAPNADGLSGAEVLECVQAAGASSQVVGLDLVEINPAVDVDDHSCRWAALAVWRFLIGLAIRTPL